MNALFFLFFTDTGVSIREIIIFNHYIFSTQQTETVLI